jgi:hypothetical protein
MMLLGLSFGVVPALLLWKSAPVEVVDTDQAATAFAT